MFELFFLFILSVNRIKLPLSSNTLLSLHFDKKVIDDTLDIKCMCNSFMSRILGKNEGSW